MRKDNSLLKIESTKEGAPIIIFGKLNSGLHITFHSNHIHIKDHKGFHKDLNIQNREKEIKDLKEIALKYPGYSFNEDCKCEICQSLKKLQIPLNEISLITSVALAFYWIKTLN